MYGAKISAIRLARGYTQDFLARKLNIEQTSYSKIEHDSKVKISDELIEKIACALGVTIEDIKSPTPIIMNFHSPTPDREFATQNNGVEMSENFLKIMEILKTQMENQNKILSLLLNRIENN